MPVVYAYSVLDTIFPPTLYTNRKVLSRVLLFSLMSLPRLSYTYVFSPYVTILPSALDSYDVVTEYVSHAHYVFGADLWSMLQEILARDDEGVVITHADGVYEPGKRPSKTTLKIKKELKQTIDCFFTGVGSAPTKLYTGKEIETWKYWEHQMTGEKINAEMYKEYKAGGIRFEH